MHSENRKNIRRVFLLLIVGMTFTIVVLFSWNSFAPHLFMLPEMQFKNALGLVLFIMCLSFLFRFGNKKPNWQKGSLFIDKELQK